MKTVRCRECGSLYRQMELGTPEEVEQALCPENTSSGAALVEVTIDYSKGPHSITCTVKP